MPGRDVRVHVCGASTKRRRQVVIAWAPRRWRLWQRSQLRRCVVVAVGVVAFLTHCLHLQAGSKDSESKRNVNAVATPTLQGTAVRYHTERANKWAASCRDRRGTRNATVGQALQARECACCVLSLKDKGTYVDLGRSVHTAEGPCVGVRLMRSRGGGRWRTVSHRRQSGDAHHLTGRSVVSAAPARLSQPREVTHPLTDQRAIGGERRGQCRLSCLPVHTQRQSLNHRCYARVRPFFC
jgi:hypothetical protein